MKCPLRGRMTVDVHYKSMENAYQAGIDVMREHLESTKGDPEGLRVAKDMWAFDPRPRKEAPVAKKTSPGKGAHPTLADKPFDPERCNCRRWNYGFGAQCNQIAKVDGLCTRHKNKYDDAIALGEKDLAHGRYNGMRPTHGRPTHKVGTSENREHKHPWKNEHDAGSKAFLKMEKRKAKRDAKKNEKAEKKRQEIEIAQEALYAGGIPRK